MELLSVIWSAPQLMGNECVLKGHYLLVGLEVMPSDEK